MLGFKEELTVEGESTATLHFKSKGRQKSGSENDTSDASSLPNVVGVCDIVIKRIGELNA